MDARDAQIIAAVARGWSEGRNLTYRELLPISGLRSLSAIWIRIWKFNGLVRQGWLRGDDLLVRTLRPGPRFAGLDVDGWPLEVIE